MIRSSFETSSFDEFEKVSITGEAVILERLHWRILPGNSINHSFINRQCSVGFKRVARCFASSALTLAVTQVSGCAFTVRTGRCRCSVHTKQ